MLEPLILPLYAVEEYNLSADQIKNILSLQNCEIGNHTLFLAYEFSVSLPRTIFSRSNKVRSLTTIDMTIVPASLAQLEIKVCLKLKPWRNLDIL